MTDAELDEVYAQLCRTMTEAGEARGALFLARFALLAIVRIDDAACAQRLIAEAAEGPDRAEQTGMPPPGASPA